MYIRLNNFVHLVEGVQCTLYDTRTNKAYLLDEVGSDFISYCEKNQEVEDWKLYDRNRDSLEAFVDNLLKLKLIIKTEKKYFIDKYNDYAKINTSLFFEPNYNTAHLQITNKCNISCEFCENDNYVIRNGCCACAHTMKYEQTVLDLIKIESLLSELAELNIKNIVIQGGNPLLEHELLINIFDTINNKLPEAYIHIITNGIGQINSDLLLKLKNNPKIEIKIVLFSDYKQFENDIFVEQYEFIKLIEENSIPLSISLIKVENSEIDNRVYMLCKQRSDLNVVNIIRSKPDQKEEVNYKYITATSNSGEFIRIR